MRWEEVRAIALDLPLVEDGSYHGYPALRVKGKFLVRLGDDHASIEFKALDPTEREMLLEALPATYFLPEGFHGSGVAARLVKLTRKELRAMLERRWRAIAPRAAVAALDQNHPRRKAT